MRDREHLQWKGNLMLYLTAAVAVFGALTLVNLLLTTSVIRRLRQMTDDASDNAVPSPIGEGERPDEFSVADIDGRPVSGDGHRLVAFFSPSCEACKVKLPDFVEQAAGYPGGSSRVLAVVTGDEPGVADFTSALSQVARVVVGPHAQTVHDAFQVKGFPSWCILDDDGVVRHSGVGIDRLPIPVAS